MTGFGESTESAGESRCRVELRSVNNRHLKLTLKCPEGFYQLENEIERVLRETISRGTVSIAIRIERGTSSSVPQFDSAALLEYWSQLQKVAASIGVDSPSLSDLLTLPGVLKTEDIDQETVQELWPTVEKTLRGAAAHMQEFRQREGSSMADELRLQCGRIGEIVIQISANAPKVIDDYRTKLLDRVNELVKELDSRLGPSEVLREVALFADRCDITEEITRLRSHLSQFLKLVDDSTSQGRKLDFMCQELFREVNTIGSKANHVGVAHLAVEAKVCIERMREIVQNVE